MPPSSPPDRPVQSGITVWHVHREKVELPFHRADHSQCLADVGLGMTGILPQWHEHLALLLTPQQHVALHDHQPTAIPVLGA
jgi:hypothetical protein